MNDLNYSQFLNAFDITFLSICLISIFFGIKNGLLKSFFNLIKWVLIFFILKNCFALLRPVADQYITNETLSDVPIFTTSENELLSIKSSKRLKDIF